MSAIGKRGRPTRAEKSKSEALTKRLCAEYMRGQTTYQQMADREGMSGVAIYLRVARGRERMKAG